MAGASELLEELPEGTSEGKPPWNKSLLQSPPDSTISPMCSHTSEHLCASGFVHISKPDFHPGLHQSASWMPLPGCLPSSSNSPQINLNSLSAHHKFSFHSWIPIPMNDTSIYPAACKRNMRINPASISSFAIYIQLNCPNSFPLILKFFWSEFALNVFTWNLFCLIINFLMIFV